MLLGFGQKEIQSWQKAEVKVKSGLQASERQYSFQAKVLEKVGRNFFFFHNNNSLDSFSPSSGALTINPVNSPLHMAVSERKCCSNAFVLSACPCSFLLPTRWQLGEPKVYTILLLKLGEVLERDALHA